MTLSLLSPRATCVRCAACGVRRAAACAACVTVECTHRNARASGHCQPFPPVMTYQIPYLPSCGGVCIWYCVRGTYQESCRDCFDWSTEAESHEVRLVLAVAQVTNHEVVSLCIEFVSTSVIWNSFKYKVARKWFMIRYG